ncbi:MAG: thioredoxin-like domain-containing protein [Bacteroidales bacterium]
MKKILIMGAAALSIASCNNNTKGYLIEGTTSNKALEGKMVLLQVQEGRELLSMDTAFVENGKFTFKGEQATAAYYFISAENGENIGVPSTQFILENSKYTVSLDSITEVSGSELNNKFRAYASTNRELSSKQNAIRDKFSAMVQDQTITADIENQLKGEFEKIDAEKIELAKSFVNTNLNNIAGANIFAQIARMLPLEEQESIINSATGEFLTQKPIDQIKENIAILKRSAVGQPFVDIRMATPEGDTLAISDLVGKHKVIMIDFWATWCGPCRAEMPRLVELYKNYNKKGLEIIGVSLDRDEASWKNYIKSNKLEWKHISDLQFWNSAGAKAYGVNSIPHIVLLDEKGTIISRGLHGQELIDKVTELLK